MVLVEYWPLNEESGTTATDVRNGNDGIVRNGGDSTVVGANGIIGETCYSFDGVNDVVEVSATDQIPNIGDSEFSVSVWAYLRNFTKNFSTIVGKEDKDTDAQWNLYRYRETSDLSFWTGDGAGHMRFSEFNMNQWHHFTVTYRKGVEKKVYVDGVEVASESAGSTSDKTEAHLGIGDTMYNGIGSRSLDGKIQDVRIYNHALSPQEISNLYSVGKRGLHTSDKRSL